MLLSLIGVILIPGAVGLAACIGFVVVSVIFISATVVTDASIAVCVVGVAVLDVLVLVDVVDVVIRYCSC